MSKAEHSAGPEARTMSGPRSVIAAALRWLPQRRRIPTKAESDLARTLELQRELLVHLSLLAANLTERAIDLGACEDANTLRSDLDQFAAAIAEQAEYQESLRRAVKSNT